MEVVNQLVLQPLINRIFNLQAHYLTVFPFPELVLDGPQQVGSIFFRHVQVHVPHDPVSCCRQDLVSREEQGQEFLYQLINQNKVVFTRQAD